MSVEELKREEELHIMFEFDDKTKKKIKKINNYYVNNDDAVVVYFVRIFNILHQDVINTSKDRYVKYFTKHIELKNDLKELLKNKNNYTYKEYMNMYNDIKKQIEDHKRTCYSRSDSLYKTIGEAKFLLDEKICEGKKFLKKLNKLKKYIIYYYQ